MATAARFSVFTSFRGGTVVLVHIETVVMMMMAHIAVTMTMTAMGVAAIKCTRRRFRQEYPAAQARVSQLQSFVEP